MNKRRKNTLLVTVRELSLAVCTACEHEYGSWADIAKRTGLHANTVRRIATGVTRDPRMSTMVALCQAADLKLVSLGKGPRHGVLEVRA